MKTEEIIYVIEEKPKNSNYSWISYLEPIKGRNNANDKFRKYVSTHTYYDVMEFRLICKSTKIITKTMVDGYGDIETRYEEVRKTIIKIDLPLKNPKVDEWISMLNKGLALI